MDRRPMSGGRRACAGLGSALLLLTALSSPAAEAGARPGTAAPRVPTSRSMEATATDLDTLGGSFAYAYGINDDGFVTGFSVTTGDVQGHAFVRDPLTGTMNDLETLGGIESFGNAIDGDGRVVGKSLLVDEFSYYHAFVSNAVTGELRDLGTLGGPESVANAINDVGVVAGASQYTELGPYHAVTWDLSTVSINDLGTLGGATSWANGINDDGFVVGASSTLGDGALHAFIWDGAGMTDLGTLGGGLSEATAINDDGVVVGFSSLAGDTVIHAFMWDPVTEDMTDLGTLGGTTSKAYGINDDGLVVGQSFTAGNAAQHAVIWDPAHGDKADLGTLGGPESSAAGINAEGVVVGSADLVAWQPRAVVWTPPFDDVPLTHPFGEDIVWLVDNGITTGFPDGTFRPGAVVTRQATAAFLYRSAGAPDGPEPTCSAAPFTDVPADHPFCGEINWAAENDLTTGFPDGSFRPAATVTRQAITAFLYRLAGAPGGADPSCAVGPFTDVPPTHPFCGEIAWAAGNGITTGYPDGAFRPGATVTRQATAAFIHRYDDLP